MSASMFEFHVSHFVAVNFAEVVGEPLLLLQANVLCMKMLSL